MHALVNTVFSAKPVGLDAGQHGARRAGSTRARAGHGRRHARSGRAGRGERVLARPRPSVGLVGADHFRLRLGLLLLVLLVLLELLELLLLLLRAYSL